MNGEPTTQTHDAMPDAAMTRLVIGVTSHRNLAPGEVDALRQRIRGLLRQLQRDFPDLPLTVLSPLAQGGDQLVAEEGLALGAELIAPLPFAREAYAEDFAAGPAREHFNALCARARVFELALLPGHTDAEVAARGVERNRHYAQAGMFVARHCHLLLAIWDGKPSSQMGGTAQIVDYFVHGTPPGDVERRRDRRRGLLYGGGGERVLCHLVCSRNTAEGAPAAPWLAGQVIWHGGADVAAPGTGMPDAFRGVCRCAGEFNADARKYAAKIAARGAVIQDAPPEPGQREGHQPSSPAVLFRAADWLAMHFQRRVLLAMRGIYLIAFVMGMAFTVYDNLPAQDNMLYVFLCLFATGIVLSAIAKRRSWHRKYLDYRALAEGLRVQCHWRRAGISLTRDPEFAHDNLLQKQDIELGWVRNAMRSAGLADDAPGQPDAADVRAVIADWVGDAGHGELGYYRARTAQRERVHRLNEAIGALCLLAAIFLSVFMAVLVHRLSADAKNILIVLMAVFSIFAAVREAYSFRKADRELIRQYRFMERVFANARKALDGAESADEEREILRALGEAALAEHVEWAVLHRQRPLEAGKM